jgi:exosortase/archaeosortase family protein
MAARKRSRRRKSQGGLHASRLASPLLGFGYPLIVAAIAAPLFAVYFYPYAENGVMAAGVHSYLAGYAKLIGTLISAFDSHVVVNGELIAGPMFSMRIIRTCDAMEVNILLVAALAGFPMRLRRRLAAVLVSVFLLVLVNVIRIGALYWLGAHAPTWFDRAHQTFAPLCMVVCATAIFLVAISRTPPRSSEDEVGRRVLS